MGIECNDNIIQATNWIKKNFTEETNANVIKQKVYMLYCNHCAENKLPPLSTTDFEILIKQVYPNINQVKVATRGRYKFCYLGLKIHPSSTSKFTIECSTNYSQVQPNENVNHLSTNENTDTPLAVSTYVNNGTSYLAQELVNNTALPNSSSVNDKDEEVNENVLRLKILPTTTENEFMIVTDEKQESEPKHLGPKVKYKEYRHPSVKDLIKDYSDIKLPTSIYRLNINPKIYLSNDKMNGWYIKQFLLKSDKLRNLTITKIDGTATYDAVCECCNINTKISHCHAMQLKNIKNKLVELMGPKDVHIKNKAIFKALHMHPSIKKLFKIYPNLEMSKRIYRRNINVSVRMNKNDVLDWYVKRVECLQKKISDSTKERSPSPVLKLEPQCEVIPLLNRPLLVSSRQSKAKMMNFCEIDSSDSSSVEDEDKEYLNISENSDSSSSDECETEIEEPLAEIVRRKRIGSNDIVKNTVPLKKEKLSCNVTSELPPLIEISKFFTTPAAAEVEKEKYICGLCTEPLENQEQLDSHEKSHLGCRTCKRKLRDLEIMRQHLEKHCYLNRRKSRPVLKLFRIDSVPSIKEQYASAFSNYEKYIKPNLTLFDDVQHSYLKSYLTSTLQKPILKVVPLADKIGNKSTLSRKIVIAKAVPNRSIGQQQTPTNANIVKYTTTKQKCNNIPSVNTNTNSGRRIALKVMQISTAPNLPTYQTPAVITQSNNTLLQFTNQNPVYQDKTPVLRIDNSSGVVLLNQNLSQIQQNPNIVYRTVIVNNVNTSSAGKICLTNPNNTISTNAVNCTPLMSTTNIQQPANVLQIVGPPGLTYTTPAPGLTYTTPSSNATVTYQQQYKNHDHSYHQLPVLKLGSVTPTTSKANQTNATVSLTTALPFKPAVVTTATTATRSVFKTSVLAASMQTEKLDTSGNLETSNSSAFRIRVRNLKDLS